MSRALPGWDRGEAPAYPRGIGPTTQGRPAWTDSVSAKHKADALKIKRLATSALSAVQKTSDALLSELKAKYRAIDEAHSAALWTCVRKLFDYPVFIAAPKAVGITSTGETGEGVPNDLPALLAAYRDFETWLEQGLNPESMPNFPVPSAA